jgi:hypothetical protein
VEAGPVDCYGSAETLLSGDEISATALAIDATHVYWSSPGYDCSSGLVRRIAKSGGEVTTLAADESAPRAVTVDDASVYFYDGCGADKVRSVGKAGGPAIDLLVDANLVDDARVVAVDSENVYFNDWGILSVPKAGGKPTIIDSVVYATALAADDAGVFWVGPLNGANDYAVMVYHRGDTSASLLTKVTGSGSGIALDEGFVYFNSSGSIRRVSRSGGPVYIVTEADAWKLTVDDTHVYWTEGVLDGSCRVKKAPKDGAGETTEIASCTGGYLEIAVDDVCVYWTNLYADNVMRAPK